MHPSARRLAHSLSLVALIALASCHDSDAPVNLNGTWRLAFQEMTEGAFVCSIEALDVRIVHSGAALTGTQVGPALRVCVVNASTIVVPFTGETLSGQIAGSAVTFTLGVVPGTQDAGGNSATGMLEGDVISGSASWDDSAGSSSLVGTFTATRMR